MVHIDCQLGEMQNCMRDKPLIGVICKSLYRGWIKLGRPTLNVGRWGWQSSLSAACKWTPASRSCHHGCPAMKTWTLKTSQNKPLPSELLLSSILPKRWEKQLVHWPKVLFDGHIEAKQNKKQRNKPTNNKNKLKVNHPERTKRLKDWRCSTTSFKRWFLSILMWHCHVSGLPTQLYAVKVSICTQYTTLGEWSNIYSSPKPRNSRDSDETR